jgi:hypothetical protein
MRHFLQVLYLPFSKFSGFVSPQDISLSIKFLQKYFLDIWNLGLFFYYLIKNYKKIIFGIFYLFQNIKQLIVKNENYMFC